MRFFFFFFYGFLSQRCDVLQNFIMKTKPIIRLNINPPPSSGCTHLPAIGDQNEEQRTEHHNVSASNTMNCPLFATHTFAPHAHLKQTYVFVCFFANLRFGTFLLFVCFVLFQNRVDACLHKSSQTRNFSTEMNNLLDKHEPANRFFFPPPILPSSPPADLQF